MNVSIDMSLKSALSCIKGFAVYLYMSQSPSLMGCRRLHGFYPCSYERKDIPKGSLIFTVCWTLRCACRFEISHLSTSTLQDIKPFSKPSRSHSKQRSDYLMIFFVTLLFFGVLRFCHRWWLVCYDTNDPRNLAPSLQRRLLLVRLPNGVWGLDL